MAVVMKIANYWHLDARVGDALADFRDRGGSFFVVHRHTHQLRAGSRQRDDLIRGGARVGGVGVRHRLHDNRRG